MIRKPIRKTGLGFDERLFAELRRAYEVDTKPVSAYWREYVQSIVSVIERDQLTGFGNNYFLTQGFGDALKTTVPRHRLRKILKFPVIYKTLEKYSAIYRYQKVKNTLFGQVKEALKDQDFVACVAKRLDPVTRELGINRYTSIEGKHVPYRYVMFLLYLEMLSRIATTERAGLRLEDILDGNYMDIGGGYGCTPDGVSLFKEYRAIGQHTVNYTLDQFPVTFIANQFLKFRSEGNSVETLYFGKTQESSDAQKTSASCFKVIQNDVARDLKGLDIKFFFNANSFQEMDAVQIKEYCEFIKANKTPSAYLAAFFYDTAKDSNAVKMPLDILNNHFSVIGCAHIKELFNNSVQSIPHGIIKGTMYLFRLD